VGQVAAKIRALRKPDAYKNKASSTPTSPEKKAEQKREIRSSGMARKDKVEARQRRKLRIRKKIQGTEQKPRLTVFKSIKQIYAQLVDDTQHRVLTGISTLNKEVQAGLKSGGNSDAAKKVGEAIGKKALGLGITEVVFDRNGFKYHGRIKALADGAREAGLKF
jgi:large subunit ribosomal protein L18